MTVRAFYSAVATDQAAAPFNTLQLKTYYPARHQQSEEEHNMGFVPADDSLAPFPVVIMMPGSNCSPESYSWLAHSLAQRGLVTLLYSWVKEDMPGYISLSPGFDLRYLKPDSYGSGPSASALPALLSALEAMQAEGLLAGKLALDKIILGGHSAGGNAVLLNTEPRWFPQVKAGFSYAAHSGASTALGFPEDTLLPLPSALPLLLMGGTHDGVIAASSNRYGDDQESSPTSRIERSFHEAIERSCGDTHLLLVEGANHFCFVDPNDGATGRPFLDWDSPHDGNTLRQFFSEVIWLFIDAHVNSNASSRRQLQTLLSPDAALVHHYQCK